jgi:hypothetical protein
MRYVICVLIMLFAAPAFSCELLAGPGKVIRYSEGETGGMASVACVFHDRWEVAAYWIGEQRIYNDQVRIAAYPAVSFSKLWTFREGKRFRPFLGMGLLVKGAQRCTYDGDLNCNRQLPLPFASCHPRACGSARYASRRARQQRFAGLGTGEKEPRPGAVSGADLHPRMRAMSDDMHRDIGRLEEAHQHAPSERAQL